jgi:hypothetical protein
MSSNKFKKEQPFTLSEEEIIERLRTDDTAIIDEIHKTCFDILYKEEEHTKFIDSKGSSLIGIIGLSSSLVFTLGGILIEKITNVNFPIIGCPIPWLVLLYFSSSLTLLIAIFYSFLTVRVRADWRWLKDEDIFHNGMIAQGIKPYKRYMSVHAWKIFQNNFKINESKAINLKRAQLLFIIALGQLIPIIVFLSLYALKKGGYF